MSATTLIYSKGNINYLGEFYKMLRKASEVLQKLENPHVRNLFWALASPNTLAEEEFPQLFPDHLMQQLWMENEDFFYALDEAPHTLENYTERYSQGRLGHYFEALLRYFIEKSPSTESVLSNFQINEDKTTIGEIDLVFDWNGTRYHWEIAIKYFAMINEGLTWREWIGPSGDDRLDIKLNHVFEHQIPLITHPQVQRIVGENVQSYLFLKGKFFANTTYPDWINKKQEVGIYLREKEIRAFIKKEQITEIYQLERPHFLADFEKVQDKFKIVIDELQHQRTPLLTPDNPSVFYRMRRGKKYIDVVMVANCWPR